MFGMTWLLDLLLVILLTATLFHAVRLERALGVLKRDRAELETLVATFNASTRAARVGDRTAARMATDGAGRQIQRQIDTATTFKERLSVPWLHRAEGSADRLDELIRATRPIVTRSPAMPIIAAVSWARTSSSGAHKFGRVNFGRVQSPRESAAGTSYQTAAESRRRGTTSPGFLAVGAERDLFKALRMAR